MSGKGRVMKECPICKGYTLRCEVQPPLLPGRHPIPLATCENPDCQLSGYTLREDRYSDFEYLKSYGISTAAAVG